MFSKIRIRLTTLYSGVLVLFLLAIIGVCLASLYYIVYHDLRQELQGYVKSETIEHHKSLEEFAEEEHDSETDDEDRDEDEDEEEDDDDDKYENISGLDFDKTRFLFVVSDQGIPIIRDEIYPTLSVDILEKLKGWIPESGEMRLEKFSHSGQDVYLAFAGQPYYNQDRFLGVIYGGKDVTTLYLLINKLSLYMLIIAAFFLLCATSAGFFLAGRAMIPITKAFADQRRFLADASHELRSPLSILQSSLEVVQNEPENRITSFSKQVLDDMSDEVKRMTRLVGDLLTLARADSGALELQKAIFDFSLTAEQMYRSFSHLAESKKIRLSLEGVDRAIVFADRERLAQLLCIMLDNAIKYTPDGGKVLLQFSLTPNGKRQDLRISVQDNGIGIAPEHIEKVFERFYRVDKNRSRETGNVGLGLSIAKWIVESHGGAISLQSSPGNGSTFTAVIPVSKTN